MWCSGSLHPSLGNSWRQFNSVHPDQCASLVQPGRRRGVAIAETRVRISDGAPNFFNPARAVSLTEKPRASNAAACGFDSCTAFHFTRAAETQRAECESSKLEAAGSSPAGRFVIPRPATPHARVAQTARERFPGTEEVASSTLAAGFPDEKISRASPRG